MTPPGDIRLLLSDVDGTLVTKDKVLTPRAMAAVAALRTRGVEVAITSSRPPIGLRMLVEPLAITLPLAGFNGGVLTQPDLTTIETRPLDPSAAHDAAALLLSLGLDLWVYTADAWCVRRPDGAHVEREAWILKVDPVIVSEFGPEQLDHAVKIVGVSDDHDLVARSEASAQQRLGASASATRSEGHFLDVTNPRANKGEVVETLARRLNLDPCQIATIGDMPNDVLMFRKGGFSIAMGNASDAVKAEASAVTDSNENDGFAKAVERYLLNDEGPRSSKSGQDRSRRDRGSDVGP
jgi:Cof subfamily protein (haloacid dehalogenase superfamily)